MSSIKFVPSAPSTTAGRRLQAAYHEAAHAVVGAAYDILVTEIDLDAERPFTALTLRDKPGEPVGVLLRRRTRATLAGPAMSALRNEDDGGRMDVLEAAKDVFVVFKDQPGAVPGALMRELFAVQRILQTPTIKGAVESLATALLDKGRMSESELNVYLDPIRGRLGEPR